MRLHLIAAGGERDLSRLGGSAARMRYRRSVRIASASSNSISSNAACALDTREALIKLRGAGWHEIWMMLSFLPAGARGVQGPTSKSPGDTSARLSCQPLGSEHAFHGLGASGCIDTRKVRLVVLEVGVRDGYRGNQEQAETGQGNATTSEAFHESPVSGNAWDTVRRAAVTIDALRFMVSRQRIRIQARPP